MIEKTPSESYFQAQLAARASSDEIAAPTDSKTLTKALSYLSRRELRRVRRAHQFAEEAHDGQQRLSGHPYLYPERFDQNFFIYTRIFKDVVQ